MCSPRLESERHMARPQGASAGAASITGNQCIRFELRVYRTVEVCSIATVCVLLVYVHAAGVPPGNSRLYLNPLDVLTTGLRRMARGRRDDNSTGGAAGRVRFQPVLAAQPLPYRYEQRVASTDGIATSALLALVRPRLQGRAGSCTGESSTVYWCGASTGNALPSTLRIRRRATYRSSSGRRQSRRPDGA